MKSAITDKELQAAREFISLRDRHTHPKGSFDNAKRWYPDEYLPCCSAIRGPSRAFPYSYMTHCRTAAHVANSHGVDVSKLRKAAREIEGPIKNNRACPNGIAYKKVALDDRNRPVSVYDGSPWLLGIAREDKAKRDHNGGLYVYETLEDARTAPFPDSSVCADADKIIIKCRVEGTYCRYGNKLAYSRVTPLTVAEIC